MCSFVFGIYYQGNITRSIALQMEKWTYVKCYYICGVDSLWKGSIGFSVWILFSLSKCYFHHVSFCVLPIYFYPRISTLWIILWFVFCRRGRTTANMTTSCPIPWDQPQTDRQTFLTVLNPGMDRKPPQQASDQWTHQDSLLITWAPLH